jgi:uncharacterized protein YegL
MGGKMINIDFDNPSPRLPVTIVTDTSSSMGWGDLRAIDLLNMGLKRFKSEVEKDELACMSVETALINCGAEVKVIREFENIYNLDIPHLTASGGTPLGESVILALDKLEERKLQYRKHGIQYYQPMLVIMTDGYATSDIREAVRKLREKSGEGKLTVVCVAIGNDADEKSLAFFHPEGEVLSIDKIEFDDFFRWLSESVRAVSGNCGSYRGVQSFTEWKAV